VSSLRDLMNLQGRVALITGATGHIGRALSESLAEQGANIVVLDRIEEDCSGLVAELESHFEVECMSLVVDLCKEEAINSVPEVILERFGRLDILINCAALVASSELEGWAVPFLQQRFEPWRMALEVNLTAPCVLIQKCAEALAQSGKGTIINIGSIYGMLGPDMSLYEGTSMGNVAAYAASKGGLLQLTRWLATVMAPAVRVNAISVGGVWRDQPEIFQRRYVDRTPLKRMAKEEDLKGAVAYLSSDLSSYVTGQNLVVDGGWSAW
jgi:NAD(P)-dependent dehydrogenase (short-subunit alcohol dehydrogenase family)